MQMIDQKASGKFHELSAVRKGGEIFPAEISINEFKTRDGTLLLLNVQDVTQRHELERIKREFVAMVSHDLRTPLTSVQGSLTLLSSGALGNQTQEAQSVIDTAESEIGRLAKLVNDLLDVARIEAGKMDMHLQETPIAVIIRRSAAAVGSFAEQHQIKIEHDDSPARVQADPERLIQVLVNLLSNAVKFSPPDSKVSICTQTAGEWLEVRVHDDGRGIPPEHKEAIFRRFHQVEDGDANIRQGTGLGLPICKTIIEQHGGTIGVESEVGKGSTFWFRVHIAQMSINNVEQPAQNKAADPASRA
jgi:signal transduction histidine kinase